MTIYESPNRVFRILKRTYLDGAVRYIIQYGEKSAFEGGKLPDNAWKDWVLNEGRYEVVTTFERAKAIVDLHIKYDTTEFEQSTYTEEIL